MALDFPNSPTLNQTFTAPNGTIWMWDGVKWVAITSTSAYVSSGNVGRNLIHNPLFNVAQRGAGPWTVSGYTADRWSVNFITDTGSIAVGAMDDSGRSVIGDESARLYLYNSFTGNAAAAAQTFVDQHLETVHRLSGKTVTVSFWVASSSAALKLGINMYQVFGTGGSPSAFTTALATGIAVSTSPTWTRVSATIPLPSAAGKTVGTNGDDYTILRVAYSSGATANQANGNIGVQSGVINIWGVQLEVGSVATPLEKPDPRYDLANCQRFYQAGSYTIGGYQLAGWGGYTMVTLSPVMRALPTAALSSLSFNNCGSPTVGIWDQAHIQISVIITANGAYSVSCAYTASADL